MAAENLHLEKYRHNKKILGEPLINKTQNNDWAITIAFYCALHLIEKTIARSDYKKHTTSHEERNNRVRTDKKLKPIAGDYLFLYNQSRRARYDCVSFGKKDMAEVLDSLTNIEKLLV